MEAQLRVTLDIPRNITDTVVPRGLMVALNWAPIKHHALEIASAAFPFSKGYAHLLRRRIHDFRDLSKPLRSYLKDLADIC